MPSGDEMDQAFSTLLCELVAVRKRVDHAREWLRSGVASMTAAGLAERTNHLCQQASQCNDPNDLRQVLTEAKECLRDLERVLGLH